MSKLPATPAGSRPRFHAVLRPHRSLGPVGFWILMGLICAVSFGAGIAFLLSGAWPVFGFLGLDVLAIYWAFRASYRSGRLFETIELTDGALTVQRVSPSGRVQRWEFQPYWLRVELEEPPQHSSQITLASHGRSLVVGAFLPPDERHDFAAALRTALAESKLSPGH